MSGSNNNHDTCEVKTKDEAGKVTDEFMKTMEEDKRKEIITKEDLTKFQAELISH